MLGENQYLGGGVQKGYINEMVGKCNGELTKLIWNQVSMIHLYKNHCDPTRNQLGMVHV